jgi:hypothetical protein
MSERSDLEKLSATGGTIQLGKVTYTLSRLTLGDYGRIQSWLKERIKRPFQLVAEALKDLEPLRLIDAEAYERSRKDLMLAAMQDSRKNDGTGADSASVEDALGSPDGIAYALWLSVRHQHPNTTLETIKEVILDEDLKSIKDKLDEITLFQDDEEDEDSENPSSGQTKRSKQKK